MQAASAFAIVQGAFGWLVDNYPRLADWNASARRIASLMMSLDGFERAEQSDELGRINHGETEGDAMLSLDDLSVTLDDGTSVVKETEVAVEPGERVLVSGESGSGKSTLVRAIAGLWPWGSGSVNFHPTSDCSCCRNGLTSPPARFAVWSAYPAAADNWTLEGDQGRPRQGRPRPSRRPDQGRRAVGPDPVGRRKAAARLRAPAPASLPTSSCWMKRPRRSTRRARTR